MIEEIYRVFQYPKFAERLGHLNFSVEEFIERLTERAMVIADPPEETVVISDPDDNKFLACAVACGAHLIVSGDEHLLTLKTYQGIAIVSPRVALRTIK